MTVLWTIGCRLNNLLLFDEQLIVHGWAIYCHVGGERLPLNGLYRRSVAVGKASFWYVVLLVLRYHFVDLCDVGVVWLSAIWLFSMTFVVGLLLVLCCSLMRRCWLGSCSLLGGSFVGYDVPSHCFWFVVGLVLVSWWRRVAVLCDWRLGCWFYVGLLNFAVLCNVVIVGL